MGMANGMGNVYNFIHNYQSRQQQQQLNKLYFRSREGECFEIESIMFTVFDHECFGGFTHYIDL